MFFKSIQKSDHKYNEVYFWNSGTRKQYCKTQLIKRVISHSDYLESSSMIARMKYQETTSSRNTEVH